MNATNRIQCRYGDWFDEVRVDGVKLDPRPSQRIVNHSPDGFSWGYGGSGPAQLALAILLHVLKDRERSTALYQDFKFAYVAQWPQADVDVEIDVVTWCLEREARKENTP